MCTASSWAQARQKLTCKKCGEQFSVDSDVIIFRSKPVDKASKFHDISGGPKFTGVQFADNPQVYSANRIYAKYLDQWFQLRRGTVLDLGCGDGRLSLWALNAGFPLVVAVDSNIVSLQRLVRQAVAIKVSDRLLPICAAAQDFCLKESAFDLVLCFEVLYYLTRNGQNRSKWLIYLRTLLSSQGKVVLSEFCRLGRLLADVVAMNVENMGMTARAGTRLEKFQNHRMKVSHPTSVELLKDCEASGFKILDKKGVSPVSMLFHYAHTFTSYPLRPALGPDLKRTIDLLEDSTSEVSELSRNIVLLLKSNKFSQSKHGGARKREKSSRVQSRLHRSSR